MAKRQQISPIGTSEAVLSIILNATGQLEDAQKAEQFRIFNWIERRLRTGKTALDLKDSGNGVLTIKPTQANIAKVNGLISELNIQADPALIKPAVEAYNSATIKASQTNRKYYADEFASYVHKPAHNIPLDDLIQNTLDSTTRGQYTSAFENPIRQTVFRHVQQGADFQTLVDNLENQITGIVPRGQKTWSIRNGLLENYHQLKRLTRDTMFQTLANETNAIAQSLGPDTVWYQYIGGKVDDTRDECIRRMALRYFSRAEVDSWKKLTKKQWPEQIPNVEPLIQRGGWNCLHDLRIISVRRVPEERLRESLAQGFINQDQFEKAMSAKGFKVDEAGKKTGKKKPTQPKKKKPAPVDTAPPDQAEKIDLRKELGIKASTKNLSKKHMPALEKFIQKQGLGSGFGVRTDSRGRVKGVADLSGFNIDSVNVWMNTLDEMKQKYGYVVNLPEASIVKMNANALQVGFSPPDLRRLRYHSHDRLPYSGFRISSAPGINANMSASGIGMHGSKKFMNGDYADSINKNTLKGYYATQVAAYEKQIPHLHKLKAQVLARLDAATDDLEVSHWKRQLANIEDDIEMYGKRVERYREKAKTEEAPEFKKWVVTKDRRFIGSNDIEAIRATAIHEFGHVLNYQSFGIDGERFRTTVNVMNAQQAGQMRTRWNDIYRKYKNSDFLKEYSKYGNSEPAELFAESFVIYNYKPELLPDDIREIIDEAVDLQKRQLAWMKKNGVEYGQ
jgi:hypothetical protein